MGSRVRDRHDSSGMNCGESFSRQQRKFGREQNISKKGAKCTGPQQGIGAIINSYDENCESRRSLGVERRVP